MPASALDVVRTARGTSRIARAAMTSLSALGEARVRTDRDLADRARALAMTMRHLCAIHAIDVEVRGELPDWPCLLVANHLSYLDPLVILSHLPAVPLAKGEVAQWPLVGVAGEALGVRWVDRGAALARARLLRGVVATLRAGVSVLNFAEGTTSDGRALRRFHRGGFGAAMLAQVPVVPLALRFDDTALAWTGDATFVPHYWQTSTRPTVRARLTVLPAMWPEPGDRAEDFAACVRAVIARALDDRPRA